MHVVVVCEDHFVVEHLKVWLQVQRLLLKLVDALSLDDFQVFLRHIQLGPDLLLDVIGRVEVAKSMGRD